MPFIPHTPESLVRRADSKNPATTCKGITTSGTHCRRSLASSRRFPHLHHHKLDSRDGVLAVLEPGNGEDEEGAAAYFCWQHKDQAATLVNNPAQPKRMGSVIHLKKRTSVDTLAERLGLLQVDTEGGSRHRSKRQWESDRPARRDRLPGQWRNVQGPVISLPAKKNRHRRPSRGPEIHEKKQSQSGLSLLCCFSSSENERLPPPRIPAVSDKSSTPVAVRVRTPVKTNPPLMSAYQSSSMPGDASTRRSNASVLQASFTPSTPPLNARPRGPNPSLSPTQTLLSIIPPTLSPSTTSALLAELAKPLPDSDEAGYIYMFWLTFDSDTPPGARTAQSLRLDSNSNSNSNSNSHKDSKETALAGSVVRNHRKSTATETLLLKIGRASNVQRRLNEWTRQCGYNVSLIRFYPPVSTHPSAKPPTTHSPSQPQPPLPRKVPHVQRVERLIHIELADKRVRRDCDACGREHREWFSVQRTRVGLRDVDAVVKRWVGWAERLE